MKYRTKSMKSNNFQWHMFLEMKVVVKAKDLEAPICN